MLVSAGFLSEFDKLQKKVAKFKDLEKEMEEAKAKADENQSLQNALTNFQSEYEQMKEQNKLEIERRIKASEKEAALKKKFKTLEKTSNNYKLNVKRLEKAKREVSKSYARAKEKVDVLSIDLMKRENEIKQQVVIQKEMGKLMKRREKELERERQERLKDMHTKEIQTRTVAKAVAERDRLANRIGMQDSIANQHVHESYVLVEALRCSKRVSEVYSEDLAAREDELQTIKERLARMETKHKDALQTIEEEHHKRRDLERQHRRLQAYMMANAKSKSEIMGIMDPNKSRLIDNTLSRVGGAMGAGGGSSNFENQHVPDLGEFHDIDMEEDVLVIRRDVEPPLYQAPTFSHLIRSQEQLKIVRRPGGMNNMGVLSNSGSRLPGTSSMLSRIHGNGPTPSDEPLGFGAAGSRFVRTPRLDAVSEETLKIVQAPPRMMRNGSSMASTNAVGRPLIAPNVGPEAGGATDTYDVPWFQDAADGIRPPGMLGKSRSVPRIHGSGSSLFTKKKKKYKRRDGNSVADNDGSLFLGHGLGLRKTKVERTMKGSARQILDQIVARIDHSKIADISSID